jgi:diguanylate cyclase (GGDEF)-like protein
VRVPRSSDLSIGRWAVWSIPRRVLLLLLAVELGALAALVTGTTTLPAELSGDWALTLAVLVAAGVLSTEASLGVERRRHHAEDRPHIDLSSVWTFAAAVLLPGVLAALVVIVIYGHLYARAWWPRGVPPHRVVYSTAAIVLAAQAAAGLVGLVDVGERFRTLPGLLLVVLALLVYALINMVLVVGVMALAEPARDAQALRQVLGRVDEAVLEFATLSMGALAAGAISAFGPVYAVFVLPTLIVLHRTVLLQQLEREASTDGKTGLLNAAGWQVRADAALRRGGAVDARATVLVLDIDHFKRVNDAHGHLVGDRVLSAVAAEIKAEVREEDVVGRFGGEEFVVLLVGLDRGSEAVAAAAVAERIRRRIEQLVVHVDIGVPGRPAVVRGLTASIGGATSPDDGHELLQLVEGADTAMYAAKRAGRNTVRMGARPVAGARG